MKCGLICARSARTSASISRVRDSVELGELELAADPRRHLVGRADQAAGGVRGADHERADQGVLDDERAHDGLPDLAAAVVADQGALVHDHRAPGLRDLPDRAGELRAVVAAEAVPREQAAGVTQPGGRRAEQRAQVAYGPLRRSPWSGPRAGPGWRGRRCAARGRRRGRPRRPATYAATAISPRRDTNRRARERVSARRSGCARRSRCRGRDRRTRSPDRARR